MHEDIAESRQAEGQIENLAKFPSENPSPVLRIGRDGTLLYANEASESLLKEWKCQVGQAVGEWWREKVVEAFESGLEKRVESKHAGRTYSFAIAPVAEAGYANLYGRDITERKRAEDELRAERDKLESVFAAMNDGIYIANQEYDIEYVNSVLVAEFGPYEGRKCYDYFHDRKEVCPWCKNPDVFAGKTVHWEWFSPKNGKTYDLIDTPLKNPDGSISKLEIFRDITERKQAAEEREVLLHDMGERSKELACMYSVAKSIRDRKTTAEILEDVADCIPGGWQYPEITRGKVRFGRDEFVSAPFEETEWKQTADIVVNGKCCGSIEVYYIEERPELDEGPFMAEERNLIEGMARAVSEGIERKEAQEKIADLARFPSENPNPVLRIAEDGTLLYANDASQSLLNEWKCRVGQAVGEWWRERVVEAFESGSETRVETEHGDRTFSFAITPVAEAGYANLYGRDITERKRVEEERERLLKILEGKNRELQEVIYIASHDLKSPLVNILGFSSELTSDCERLGELLGKEELEKGEREMAEALLHRDIPEEAKFITAAAQMLKTLINGLLEVSRAGSAQYAVEQVKMNELVAGLVAGLKFEIKQCYAQVTVEGLPDCVADGQKLKRVFSNLVGNALKYLDHERAGVIRISGRCEGGRSVYCVEDNGIGIAEGHQEKVFEIFHRLDPDDGTGGDGLGLAIATRMLDRMEGSIWVESKEGEGSRFFVSLPSV